MVVYGGESDKPKYNDKTRFSRLKYELNFNIVNSTLNMEAERNHQPQPPFKVDRDDDDVADR